VAYRIYWREVNNESKGDTGFVSYNWIIVEGSDTSAFIHGLDPCKDYEMGIVTQCDSSLSRWETAYVFNSLSSCKAPNDVLVYNVRSGQAQVSWSKIKGAERYTVKYRPKSGGAISFGWTTFDTDTNDIYLSGLTPGVDYEVEVYTHCCKGDSSGVDSTYTFTTGNADCGQPKILDLTLDRTNFSVRWSGISGATWYRVMWKEADSLQWNTATVFAPDTQIVIPGLDYCKQYVANVFAVCGDTLISDWTNDYPFTTVTCPAVQPYLLGREEPGVNIGWDAIPTASSYKVSYRLVGDVTWSEVTTNNTFINLDSLVSDTLYEYQVSYICCSTNVSESSGPDTFRTNGCTPNAHFVDIIPQGDSIQVRWNHVPSAVEYWLSWNIVGDTLPQTTVLTDTSHLISGLDLCSLYNLELRTRCSQQFSNFSDVRTVEIPMNCIAPTFTFAYNEDYDQAIIGWEEVFSAESYRIQYRRLGDAEWLESITNTAPLTLINLDPNSAYEYQIQSICCGYSTSEFTQPDTFETISFDCEQPQWANPEFTESGIYVGWIPAGRVQGYILTWYADTTNAPRFTVELQATDSAYFIAAENACFGYHFELTALCNNGQPTDTIRTYVAPDTVCHPVTFISIYDITAHTAEVAWDATPRTSAYLVRYQNVNGGNVSELMTTQTNVSLTNLDDNATYVVSISSIRCGQDTCSSVIETFRTPEQCHPPVIASIQPELNGIRIRWFSHPPSYAYHVSWKADTLNASWSQISIYHPDTTFYIGNVSPCLTYRVKVDNYCSLSNEDSGTVIIAGTCIRPIFLGIDSITYTGATIRWVRINGATGYQVRYRQSGNPNWVTVSTTAEYDYLIINGLLSLTDYEVQIRSICCNGDYSEFIPIQNFRTDGCLTPIGATLSNPTETTLFASWNPVRLVASYQVQYRRLGNNGWQNMNNVDSPYVTINGLIQGTSYILRVRTYCQGGFSGWSNLDTLATLTCVVPPNITANNPTETTFRVSWNRVSNATAYSLRYRPVGQNAWSTVNNITDTFNIVSNRSVGTTYEVQVRAVCGLGQSDWSASATVTTLTCVVPPNIVLDNATETSFRVTWNRVSNATAYTLRYRQVGQNSWHNVNNLVDTFRTVSGLIPGTSYEVQVRSTCNLGTSDWSNTRTIATVTCGTPLELTAGNSTETTFEVVWDHVANATSYSLRYRRIGQNSWTNVNNIVDTFRTVTGLTPGTTYEVIVKTVCNSGNSAWSTPDTIATRACVAPPVLTVGLVTETQFTVNWSRISNATTYQVRYRRIGTNWRTVSNLTDTFYTAVNLTPGEFYEVTVRAVCNLGRSAWSNTDTVQTVDCDPPTNLTFSNVTATAFTADWTTVPNATAYSLRYRRIGQVNWQTINNIPTNTRTVSGLVSGSTYEVIVRSTCGSGVSPWSATDTVQLIGVRQNAVSTTEVWSDFSLYPNPNKGNFTIAFNSEKTDELHLAVFDVTGRLIYENSVPVQSGNNNLPFELKGIGSGMYSLRVRLGAENQQIKLVIE
jgi:hypothetical protein